MEKLIKMTSFVLEAQNKCEEACNYIDLVTNYANLLLTDLCLEMFIGEEKLFKGFELQQHKNNRETLVYIPASKVIAYGDNGLIDFYNFEIVEDLCEYEPELTETAKKIINHG